MITLESWKYNLREKILQWRARRWNGAKSQSCKINFLFFYSFNLYFKVGALIGNLKNMAIDMGGELEKQNEQIGRITGKAEMNHGRIDGANERANKILSER